MNTNFQSRFSAVEPGLPISITISIKISITIFCTVEHPLNGRFYPALVSAENLWDDSTSYYGPDAVPVTQRTVSKQ